jgi:hypothetical protein
MLSKIVCKNTSFKESQIDLIFQETETVHNSNFYVKKKKKYHLKNAPNNSVTQAFKFNQS